MSTTSNVTTVKVKPVGGSTVILEVGGLRLITDPTLDPPGSHGPEMPPRTTAPVVADGDLDGLDVALVSHDEHPDNLDDAGRELLSGIPLVLTTPGGSERLGGTAKGLAPYEHVDVERPDGGVLRITGLPAQHGPDGEKTIEVMGHVVGFLLSGEGVPTVYVSGDNASLQVVRDIHARVGGAEIAVVFAGGASIGQLFDGANLTLTSDDAAEAARILGVRAVVPIHCDGWAHYAQDSASVRAAFERAGIGDVLRVVADGETAEL